MVWKSLVGARGRSLLALASVLIPAALITAAANFALDAESKMTVELRRQGPNVILEVKRGVAAMDPVELDRALKRFPGILARGPIDRGDRVEIAAAGSFEQIDAAVRAIGGEGRTLQARTLPVIAAREGAILGKLHRLFELMALLILASSGLAMTMALASGVAERRTEIGLLKALGSTRAFVLRFFAAQVGLLLAAGVALGSAAGLALSDVMSRGVFGVSTEVRFGAVAAAAAACAVMALAASIVPARRAFAVEPARVLKGE
ncbi:MAG TPA: FtsX-like permease family protein [Candidatus Saccharimonadales bacterium]|nr:FtsX-like permease family protein [Candidatus Saccharimonadales bacterium]